ncbi:hypothetical protein PT2222_150271 [Paraburkholderia tropica]
MTHINSVKAAPSREDQALNSLPHDPPWPHQASARKKAQGRTLRLTGASRAGQHGSMRRLPTKPA